MSEPDIGNELGALKSIALSLYRLAESAEAKREDPELMAKGQLALIGGIYQDMAESLKAILDQPDQFKKMNALRNLQADCEERSLSALKQLEEMK